MGIQQTYTLQTWTRTWRPNANATPKLRWAAHECKSCNGSGRRGFAATTLSWSCSRPRSGISSTSARWSRCVPSISFLLGPSTPPNYVTIAMYLCC